MPYNRKDRLILTLSVLSLLAAVVLFAFRDPYPNPPIKDASNVVQARVINTYRHDPRAFTQGLIFHNGMFIESTGLYGQSSLRKVALEGEVIETLPLSRDFFGEGVTVLNGRLYQLTWKAGICLVYDLDSLRQVGEFHLPSDGWGLTHTDTSLVMSDGSDTLYFIDPTSFRVISTLKVHEGESPVGNLNELEYVAGKILANVYKTNYIVQIDSVTGAVLGWIDLTPIIPSGIPDLGPANGIAYDTEGHRIFVTGKNWPVLYEIGLAP